MRSFRACDQVFIRASIVLQEPRTFICDPKFDNVRDMVKHRFSSCIRPKNDPPLTPDGEGVQSMQ